MLLEFGAELQVFNHPHWQDPPPNTPRPTTQAGNDWVIVIEELGDDEHMNPEI